MDESERKILNYQVMIEESLCWKKKDQFFEIIDKFLADILSANSFKDKYWDLINKICEKAEKYKNLIESNNIQLQLDNEVEIYYIPQSSDFCGAIMLTLFTAVEGYSPEIPDSESSHYGYSPNGLKAFVKDEILPFIIEYRNM